jgi:hypothetical protein
MLLQLLLCRMQAADARVMQQGSNSKAATPVVITVMSGNVAVSRLLTS